MTEPFITSSVLIMVVIALRFLFRGKISRWLQYALWGLVLLRLLLPFSPLESSFSVMNALPNSSFAERQVHVLPISRQSVGEAYGIVVNSNRIVADVHSFGYPVLSGDGETITRYAGKMSVREILSLIWLTGSIAFLLWFMVTNMIFSRQMQKTRQVYGAEGTDTDHFPLPVYVTEQIASPCLFGLIHPAVYLTPKAAAREGVTCHVLAHELCHYRHGDHIWSVLRGLCLAVWWWNPLVWTAAILSRTDSELACDEAVIKTIGEENRFAYGHTLIDMIAVRETPSGLINAATTMASGKRRIQERLNMIIKKPKTVVPALAAVLLLITVSAVSTFTGAGKDIQDVPEQDFPVVDRVFASDSTGLEQLGRDAATFYYTQFMTEEVPQRWHLTKYEPLSGRLMAGDEQEFAVWITSYLETDGGGFLVGEGIPNDPEDLSKGGICPEVGRQFRIKALGGGKYEIVSIGTGGGAQGLAPVDSAVSYGIMELRNGEARRAVSPLSGADAQLGKLDTALAAKAYKGAVLFRKVEQKS